MDSSSSPEEIKKYLIDKSPHSLGIWDFTNSNVIGELKGLLQECMVQYSESCVNNLLYTKAYGIPEFLDSLKSFLSDCYGDSVDSLIPTYSSSYGWMLLMTNFLSSGDFLFVEEITFPGVIQAADQHGLKVTTVLSDEYGMISTVLEQQLALRQKESKHVPSSEKPFWGIVFLMTTLHNPLGYNYPAERCKALVELARKYNVLIVTDEVYNFWQFNIQDQEKKARDSMWVINICDILPEKVLHKTLMSNISKRLEDGPGHVVCNGSLSKILFPSMRLGWIEASPLIIKQLACRADVNSGGGYNGFNQGLVALILSHPGFKNFYEKSTLIYKGIVDTAIDYLKQNLPKEVTFNIPVIAFSSCGTPRLSIASLSIREERWLGMGGFMLWLVMPENLKSSELNTRLEKYGVHILPGQYLSYEKKYEHCFRVNCTNYEKDDLLLALSVLCKELKNMLN